MKSHLQKKVSSARSWLKLSAVRCPGEDLPQPACGTQATSEIPVRSRREVARNQISAAGLFDLYNREIQMAAFSRCPPNWYRMAESSLSAKSASPRELKRS
jgi:hypothetical protein